MTLGIVATLAVVALTSTSSDPVDPSPEGSSSSTTADGPTTTAVPPVQQANVAACTADAAAIDQAEQVHSVTEGRMAMMDELVAAHLLVEVSTMHVVVVDPGGQTYRLEGLAGCP